MTKSVQLLASCSTPPLTTCFPLPKFGNNSGNDVTMAFGTPPMTSVVDKVDFVAEWIIMPELEFEHLFMGKQGSVFRNARGSIVRVKCVG